MSTRCNVIIKEYDGNFFQLYHHHDGYPEGVGTDLEEYIKQMDDDCLVDGKKFTDFLCDPKHDDEYEYEGTNVCPHSDINYLYIIDLQKREIVCFFVKLFNDNVIEMRKCIKNNSLDELDFLNMEYKHKF